MRFFIRVCLAWNRFNYDTLLCLNSQLGLTPTRCWPISPAVRPPKVLLTTCYKPSKVMYNLLSELLETLPCAEYYKRNGFPLKKIVKFASNRGFTDLMVFNEDRRV